MKMRLYRILISSTTASFRYPNVMINSQLSVKSMPYSTLQGLIGAAYGSTELDNLSFSYIFRYESTFWDIETIYKFAENKGQIKAYEPTNTSKNRKFYHQGDIYPSSDAFKREHLFKCYLTLYLDDEAIAKSFLSPMFQLVLGRSSDLATVEAVEVVEVEATDTTRYCGTIIPTNDWSVPGEIYIFPHRFNYTKIPREPEDIDTFTILDGRGEFGEIKNPKALHDKFSLENWKFKKPDVIMNHPSYIDTTLQTPVILRKFYAGKE